MKAVRLAATRCPVLSEQFHRWRYSFQVPEEDDVGKEERGKEYFERCEAEILKLQGELVEQQRLYLEVTAKRKVFADLARPDPVPHDAQDVRDLERLREEEEAKYGKWKREFEEKQDEVSHALAGVVRRHHRISAKISKTLELINTSYDLENELQAASLLKQENEALERKVIEEEEAIQQETRMLQSLNEEMLQLETETADLQWQIDELGAKLSTESPSPDR